MRVDGIMMGCFADRAALILLAASFLYYDVRL